MEKNYHQKYFEDNKERLLAYQKEWYEKNKEKRKAYMRQYQKKYNQEKKTEFIKIYKLVYRGEVIYVGLTKLTLNRRKNSANYSVPKEIYKESEILLIEETYDPSRERYWIEHFLSIGCTLLNKRNGNHNESTRKSYQKLKNNLPKF
jgi:hypothetical protein